MKNPTLITATLIAAALFAGAASANSDKGYEDILHGSGELPSASAEGFVRIDSRQEGYDSYLLWNLHQIESVDSAPAFVRGDSDQDNRDDLRDSV
jgi:hypothetical protein